MFDSLECCDAALLRKKALLIFPYDADAGTTDVIRHVMVFWHLLSETYVADQEAFVITVVKVVNLHAILNVLCCCLVLGSGTRQHK